MFGSVMLYKSLKARSMCNVNLHEWPPSCCIHPYVQLYNSALRPGAHGQNFQNCLWQVMEIEEKELDKARWGSWAILSKNQWMDLHVVNCQLEVPECDSAMSSIAHIMCVAVDQKSNGHQYFGWNRVFIDMIHSLSIMTIWLFVYNDWTYTDC